MALLLAMYQKFKLTRERNTISYKLTRHSSKLTRLQNNISKKQKYYEGLMTKIQKKATDYKNMFNMSIRNKFGMGTSVFDPTAGNPYANNAIANVMYQGLIDGKLQVRDYNSEGQLITGDNGAAQTTYLKLDNTDAQAITQAMVASGGGIGFTYDESNKTYKNNDGSVEFSAEQFLEGKDAYAAAYNLNSINQQYANNAMQQYEANISIWQEAWEAQIEAEQESVLGAMQYEESMMELDKTNMETRLERIKAELENYTSMLSEEVKNAAPKFGL